MLKKLQLSKLVFVSVKLFIKGKSVILQKVILRTAVKSVLDATENKRLVI